MAKLNASGATIVMRTSNSKLAPQLEVPTGQKHFPVRHTPRAPFVASTYVSISATCPYGCPFRDAGCYAQGGLTGMVVRRLDEAALRLKASHNDVILEEAKLIGGALKQPRKLAQDGYRGGGRDLRLHVSGDCITRTGAKLLAGAARRWLARGGGKVWTYTHGWGLVKRHHWGTVSVLASIEEPDQDVEARAMGYAPALVVNRFPHGKRVFFRGATEYIPCPAETLNKTCVECRLCLDADKLRARRQGIAFAVHGQKGTLQQARQTITQLRLPIKKER